MWLTHTLEDEVEVLLVVYVVFIASCHVHHSCALEVMSLTYGHDRTSTASWDAAPHLVGVQAGVILQCIHMHSRRILK
jgi:hypothetical protein